MGCGGSSAAAQQPQVPGPMLLNGSNDKPIVPGQSAIIRNCPNAHLNGKQVVCEEYNTKLGEWQVKGEGFPLSIGMSMPTQYLEVVLSSSNDKPIVPGQSAIIRNCPNAKLNGKQVVCEEYNTDLGETEYDAIIASSLDAIKGLFEKLDLDADSTLDKSELKEIVAKYNGEAFDEEKFFGWFDVHGASDCRGPDGRLDLKEFGWYIADVACSFSEEAEARAEKVTAIIAELESML